MLTKKELEIFAVFQNNIFEGYTFQNIKDLLNEKSNNALIRALKKFEKEDLIVKKNVGKSILYNINIGNSIIFLYWEIYNNEFLDIGVKKSINIIKNELNEISNFYNFYSLIIFGSYAQGKFSQKSDLDIMIFIQDNQYNEDIEKKVENIKRKSLINLDITIISTKMYNEMLQVSFENLGKQILRKRFLGIFNSTLFYNFLKNELKNEFNL